MLRTIGACRWVYNHYLEERKNYYLETKKTLPLKLMSADLTKLRREMDWLSGVRLAPLQQSIRCLDVAYNRFFRKEAGFPKFKSRKDCKQTFRKPNKWRIEGKKLLIQSDIFVRARGKLPPSNAKLGTLTIFTTRTGKWYASIKSTEYTETPTERTPPIGIDLGLTHIAITSDGKKYDNLTFAKKQTKRMKQLQQSLRRKQSDSNRREKTRLKFARLHEKIANQRMNYLHQVSSAITSKNHALIAVEDLAVANMLKNHSLARSIGDVGWYDLSKQIEYKQKWSGGQFFRVDRFFPSSKTCSNCYFVRQSMSLDAREWTCERCSTGHDRDINAAKNILKQAEVQLGVEGTDGSRKVRVTGSVKRGYSMGVTL